MRDAKQFPKRKVEPANVVAATAAMKIACRNKDATRSA